VTKQDSNNSKPMHCHWVSSSSSTTSSPSTSSPAASVSSAAPWPISFLFFYFFSIVVAFIPSTFTVVLATSSISASFPPQEGRGAVYRIGINNDHPDTSTRSKHDDYTSTTANNGVNTAYDDKFDFVVVGAGTAGSVVGGRLAEAGMVWYGRN
jgi:anaerobic C4-dicarboxylate transporter